ncbi:MAG: 30S ribosomal protein S17 [Nanoarchaeota archaeon]
MEKAKAKNEIEKCEDSQCSLHGKLSARGRVFSGSVIKKYPRRIAISFTRTVYIQKYERYAHKKTTLHARLPDCFKSKINLGDYAKIQECRPLSKIIHFVVIEKIKSGVEEKK